ncbi:hypothetical protein GLYMA_08G063100v4 [Glycine max]|uniref:Uncharacterized protein n=3 Tax=Glycine subgen. Soja TaxID=1462606 RepID=A0A0R0IRL7_SOYBN|nr:zinc transporter ZTP29-like isoform X1 [Glycine soja]XP_040873910.1 zinc transporter ZTP29 isoform X1 [Glycine max]KAH1049917.1 hypothetical protein GYH30_020421 [Glycine max]KRH42004.1 hypothetical protein GLYMA_08G063100v4 [Glycine max]RZB95563.1 Zinc transporter ZTP29 isoform A [Glycine soja]RZB95564.1 Zinc transporter ZTP29 isoform B [Glycine soja]
MRITKLNMNNTMTCLRSGCLFPTSLNPEILEGILGSVGGVMAFVTLHQMLPLAFKYAGQKQFVKIIFCGTTFMSASTTLQGLNI